MASAFVVAIAVARSATVEIPFTDVRPILADLREDLLPPDLRRTSTTKAAESWQYWVKRRDADIRARLEDGDEDSVANLTLFGTSFTREPRVTEREISEMAGGKPAPPVLAKRIEAMASAVGSPDDNERLQFVRQLAARKGFAARSPAGQANLRRWLADRIARILDEHRRREADLLNPAATSADRATLFRSRGLSVDTSLFPGLAIEEALAALKSRHLVAPRSVRRVAIIGPGLDFSNKEEGYDFYPQQTIQPFAAIDSLRRLDLAQPAGLSVTTFDLSPRVNHHIESARARSGRGRYVLQLPRDNRYPWTSSFVDYWEHFGDRIGEAVAPIPPPVGPGVSQSRAISVHPDVVLSIIPAYLNIVLQRAESSSSNSFDVIVATNVLLYYDVFEQALALSNMAHMLRPGGLLLTNTNVATLPSIPMALIGYTDVVVRHADKPEGDRVYWYQRESN